MTKVTSTEPKVENFSPLFRTYFNWAASSEFGTYRLCEQRRFRRACASAQFRQNLRCSLIQAVTQEEPSKRKPDRWPLWTAGHAQLNFVMTECSKTQIRLSRPNISRRKWWTVAKVLFEICIRRLGLYFVLKFYQKIFSTLPVILGSLFTKYINGLLQTVTEVPTSTLA